MAVDTYSLIDAIYFAQMYSPGSVDITNATVLTRVESIIDAMTVTFEWFCNRKLKSRSYSYETLSGYVVSPEYTIFDGIRLNKFWFPTYPVTSILSFSISGKLITEAEVTDYTANTGYKLYKKKGLLIYDGGFDFGYYQNILTKWTGGYLSTDSEMDHLKYLCYLACKDVYNAPKSGNIISEKIGGYSYRLMDIKQMEEIRALSPKVFQDLSRYRREVMG